MVKEYLHVLVAYLLFVHPHILLSSLKTVLYSIVPISGIFRPTELVDQLELLRVQGEENRVVLVVAVVNDGIVVLVGIAMNPH